MHSRLVQSDSLLKNYQVTAVFSEIEFEDGQEVVKSTQKQTRRVVGKKLAEDSFSFTLGDSSNRKPGEKRSARFIQPLHPFERPELYEFKRLADVRADEIRLQAHPKEAEDIRPAGIYYFSPASLRLMRAELEPSLPMEHVDRTSVLTQFGEFRGFPVEQSMTTRVQGTFLLFFSFDRGFRIEFLYADLE